jgi:hypothetical protein
MAVPFAMMAGFMWYKDRANRGRHLGWGLALFALAVASQSVFRALYYGDLVPNTYYHKLTGYPAYARITRGLYVALVFVWRLNWVLLLVPAALIVMRRAKTEMFLACIFTGQIAYSIYVGGDAWESWGGSNRYVCIGMPCFFVLFFQGLAAIGGLVRGRLDRGSSGVAQGLAGRNARQAARWKIAAVAIALVTFNSIYGPAALAELALIKRPVHVDDNKRMVERALVIEQVTDPEARIALVWDGAIKYFSGRPAVSILGKNDRKVARERMHAPRGAGILVGFYPGHLKWDYAYSIGDLQPDLVAQLWQEPESASQYLSSRDYTQIRVGGFGMHFRKGSPHVRWDRVESLAS